MVPERAAFAALVSVVEGFLPPRRPPSEPRYQVTCPLSCPRHFWRVSTGFASHLKVIFAIDPWRTCVPRGKEPVLRTRTRRPETCNQEHDSPSHSTGVVSEYRHDECQSTTHEFLVFLLGRSLAFQQTCPVQHVNFGVRLPFIHLDFIRYALQIHPLHVPHPFLHLFHDLFTGLCLGDSATHLRFK